MALKTYEHIAQLFEPRAESGTDLAIRGACRGN